MPDLQPNEKLYALHCFAHIIRDVEPDSCRKKLVELATIHEIPEANLGFVLRQIDGQLHFNQVPVPTSLTPNQRIALAIISHVTCVATGRKDPMISALVDVRQMLAVSEFFGHFVMDIFKSIKPGGDPAELFFHPPDSVAQQVIKLTRMALGEGFGVKKRKIPGLVSEEYEHPFDKKALDTLSGTPGLETLIRKLWEYGLDRVFRMDHAGSYVKVDPRYVPHVHHAVLSACEVLQIEKIPEAYIMPGWVNAYTTCTENPIIVLSSGVCSLGFDELLFIVGHELGHIKSEHVLYHDLARNVIPFISMVADVVTLGLSRIVSSGLMLSLLYWVRQSEFTADRSGLLVCQNLEAAISSMMKIAGYPPRFYQNIDPSQFLAQAQEFESFDADKLNKVAKVINIMNETHPWTVMRCAEMKKWYDSGEYFRVLNRSAT